MENEKEKFEFQAETKQLLNLMINSIFDFQRQRCH